MFITRHGVFDEMVFPCEEFSKEFLLDASSVASQSFSQPVPSIPMLNTSKLRLVPTITTFIPTIHIDLLAPPVPAAVTISAPNPPPITAPISTVVLAPLVLAIHPLVVNDHNMTT